MPLLHYQPFKFFYVVYFGLTTALVKIPYWTLISLLPWTRPKASWSIKTSVLVYLLRTIPPLQIRLGLAKRDLSREVADSTLQGARFVWVGGIDARALVGDVRRFAAQAGVAPARVPGYWQRKKGNPAAWTPRAEEGEKVLFHLHGGGFWLGSAHPSDTTADIPRGILEHSKTITRTFALDYRLSASAPFRAENPFPTALLDCIAGYQYLLDQGFRPENIVVAGDSAGGNLALGLVRHILENDTGLATPGKLLLFSPWGDLSASRNGPDSSLVRNRKTDMFALEPPGKETLIGQGGYAVRSYIGALPKEETKTNLYISPASPHLVADGKGAFTGVPQTYILAGGAEWLLDDALVIADRINRDNEGQENRATLDVTRDAIHDFCIFPWCAPWPREAFARASKWIDE